MTFHSHHPILSLVRSKGILRAKDISLAGQSRNTLSRLVQTGHLSKLGRGLYALPEHPIDEYSAWAEIATKNKRSVICLISALRFHELTTQQSSDVWLAIPHKGYAPKLTYPPLHLIRMSDASLTAGIEIKSISGVDVPVFCVAKTIADCFKFRHKLGLDVALDALNEAWRANRVNADDLWRYAQICRVSNVMRPYLEAIGNFNV